MDKGLEKKIEEFHEKIYLDNNANTFMSEDTIQYMVKFCNLGNSSSEHDGGKISTGLMKKFREVIAKTYNFSIDKDDPESYTIIFNGNASEGNSFIINSVTRAYISSTKLKPHIIVSAVEHKSMILAAQLLADEKLIELTFAPVDTEGEYYGCINPSTLIKLIKPNTCLIAIMASNNESGCTNRLHLLGKIAHDRNIPIFVDSSQYCGKHILYPNDMHITAFSMSPQKMHGPIGVGILVIKNKLIEGYGLCAQICGEQNDKLRGGTFNIPGIAAAFNAFVETTHDRKAKTVQLLKMKNEFINRLSKEIDVFNILDFDKEKVVTRSKHNYKHNKPTIFLITPQYPHNQYVLENTIFLTVMLPNFCNIAFKRELYDNGLIIAVGSSCNTVTSITNLGSPSHVVEAMGVPASVAGNALRISIGDMNTEKEISKAVKIFLSQI